MCGGGERQERGLPQPASPQCAPRPPTLHRAAHAAFAPHRPHTTTHTHTHAYTHTPATPCMRCCPLVFPNNKVEMHAAAFPPSNTRPTPPAPHPPHLVRVVAGVQIREDADGGLARHLAAALDLLGGDGWVDGGVVLDGTCGTGGGTGGAAAQWRRHRAAAVAGVAAAAWQQHSGGATPLHPRMAPPPCLEQLRCSTTAVATVVGAAVAAAAAALASPSTNRSGRAALTSAVASFTLSTCGGARGGAGRDVLAHARGSRPLHLRPCSSTTNTHTHTHPSHTQKRHTHTIKKTTHHHTHALIHTHTHTHTPAAPSRRCLLSSSSARRAA